VILSAEYQRGGEGRLVLDDGSCVAALFVSAKEAESRFWRAGSPVLGSLYCLIYMVLRSLFCEFYLIFG
jgi:hypothetical protein